MAHSYLLGGATAGMHMRVAAPAGYQPGPAILARAQPIAAATGGSAAEGDDPASVVWDQAENRLHAQKALLAWLLERS